MMANNKETFALDIGTRSIVGLLAEEGENGVVIKEIINKEHINRAMLDGQIHNIPEVSKLVNEIKKELESKTGKRLKKVAVAAAGRTLVTVKASETIILNNNEPIKKEDVLNLELKCAQKAQGMLMKEKQNNQNNHYYCVGYSVTKYYLDGSTIGSLISQKGSKAGLDIVAAFLPKVVMESIQEVLKDNKLQLANITLEPIAAISAILPDSMRKLNLALVDIGAGTSDIAISSQGSVIGYGMVPIAGDEITEALCEKYILDFSEGEKLKRKLYCNLDNYIEFCDILGFEHSEKGLDIVDNISDEIKMLAEKIASEILSINGGPPQAVILIGGGSLTPLLPEYIAEKLNLPKQRVAVQRASSVKDIINLPPDFHGPEIVTPLGIALTAMKNSNLGFIPVKVNEREVNLLNLGENSVFDALLAAGVTVGQMYGKPGRGITVEVNGKVKTFPGTLGQKAKITVNNREAGLDTVLKPRDKITYTPAQDGQPGKAKVKDILSPVSWVTINGEKKEIPVEITVNGKVCNDIGAQLYDGDKIFIREINQLGEVLELWKKADLTKIVNFVLIINGKKQKVTYCPFEIIQNGNPATIYDRLKAGDNIDLIWKENNPCTVELIIEKYLKPDKNLDIKVMVNDDTVNLSTMNLELFINGKPGRIDDLVKENDVLEINYREKKQPILVDIFPKINFSTNPPPGHSNLKITLNNQPAEFTSPLKDGDIIKLLWI
ncbi:MAG: cell division protein [Clostridia bacterium]|nr:cell division protein [Clostridia bacterium]